MVDLRRKNDYKSCLQGRKLNLKLKFKFYVQKLRRIVVSKPTIIEFYPTKYEKYDFKNI